MKSIKPYDSHYALRTEAPGADVADGLILLMRDAAVECMPYLRRVTSMVNLKFVNIECVCVVDGNGGDAVGDSSGGDSSEI